MAICNPLPYIFQNGPTQVIDATQVNADLAQIVNNVNTNVPLLVQVYSAPIAQLLTSGTNLTYTCPLNAAGFLPLYLEIKIVGAGGGGGSGGGGGAGVAGTPSSFGAYIAGGGAGGNTSGFGGPGGSPSGGVGFLSLIGQAGNSETELYPIQGGINGVASYGGMGAPGPFGSGPANGLLGGNGRVAQVNSGSGGTGGGGVSPAQSGGGGGAGAYVKALVTPVLATYTYSVGVGGTGGTGGGGGSGGAGSNGLIIVVARWQ
jgi:hypothetical protein